MLSWITTLLVATSVWAQTTPTGKMVFMREFDGEKQIMLGNSDGSHVRALTSGKNWHIYPDLSADGSTVAYAEGPDGNHLSIVTEDLRTGSLRLWSTHPGQHFHARFSGDGRYLAYSGSVGRDYAQRIAWVDLHTGYISVIPSQDRKSVV